MADKRDNKGSSTKDQLLLPSSKKDNVLVKSVEKLKETTTVEKKMSLYYEKLIWFDLNNIK